jgi:hypothetical protein
VAEALDLRLIDATAINNAAQRAGVPRIALAELAQEGEKGLANQVLKALRAMPNLRSTSYRASDAEDRDGITAPFSGVTIPFSGLFSPTVPPISASLEGYVRMVGLVIRGLAQEGNVLILGRGGQVLLKHHSDALHLQIVAPKAQRLQVLMTQHGLSRREAQNRLRASDRARFDYLRRYHDEDWLDPALYHLVLNTGYVPVATAADLSIATWKALRQARGGDPPEE